MRVTEGNSIAELEAVDGITGAIDLFSPDMSIEADIRPSLALEPCLITVFYIFLIEYKHFL